MAEGVDDTGDAAGDAATARGRLAAASDNPLVPIALSAIVVAVLVETLTPADAQMGLGAGLVLSTAGFLLVDRSAPARLHRKTGLGPGALALAAVVLVAGLAATYRLGDPRLFCPGIHHRGCLTLYGWGSVLFSAGTLGVAILAGHYPRYRRVAGAAVEPAGEVTPGGTVAVVGRVEDAGETLAAPGTDEPAVWYHSEVVADGPSPTGPARVESDVARFYVVDGSGRALVEPTGADPYLLREYARTGSVRTPTDDGTRRTWVLGPDDVALVVADAVDTDRAKWPEPVVLGVDGEPSVVPADRERVHADLRWRVWAAAAGTLLLCGVGVGLMVLGL